MSGGPEWQSQWLALPPECKKPQLERTRAAVAGLGGQSGWNSHSWVSECRNGWGVRLRRGYGNWTASLTSVAKSLTLDVFCRSGRDGRETRFVFSSDTTPNYGRRGASVRGGTSGFRRLGGWRRLCHPPVEDHKMRSVISLSAIRIAVTPVPVDRLLLGV